MTITLFKSITTEESLQALEAEGEKYTGLVVDMDNAKERKYVKDGAALIAGYLKKLDRARIDLSRDYKNSVEAEAADIKARLEKANEPYTLLIDMHKAKRAKILAEEKAREEAKALLIRIEEDHETGLMMNKVFDIDKAEAIAAQEARDKVIADNARKDAEERLRLIEEKAKQDAIDAVAEKERLEQKAIDDKLAAEERAEQAAIKAKEDAKQAKIEAEAKAARDADLAVQREKDRAAQQLAMEKEEAARRAKDANHKRKINNESLAALMYFADIEEGDARRIVQVIAKGQIPNVTINY